MCVETFSVLIFFMFHNHFSIFSSFVRMHLKKKKTVQYNSQTHRIRKVVLHVFAMHAVQHVSQGLLTAKIYCKQFIKRIAQKIASLEIQVSSLRINFFKSFTRQLQKSLSPDLLCRVRLMDRVRACSAARGTQNASSSTSGARGTQNASSSTLSHP